MSSGELGGAAPRGGRGVSGPGKPDGRVAGSVQRVVPALPGASRLGQLGPKLVGSAPKADPASVLRPPSPDRGADPGAGLRLPVGDRGISGSELPGDTFWPPPAGPPGVVTLTAHNTSVIPGTALALS